MPAIAPVIAARSSGATGASRRMSLQLTGLSAAREPVRVPYAISPTLASAGSSATRSRIAVFAASMRGPGASVWFIEPDASSTTITGVGWSGPAGAGAAAAGEPVATAAAVSSTTASRARLIGRPPRGGGGRPIVAACSRPRSRPKGDAC